MRGEKKEKKMGEIIETRECDLNEERKAKETKEARKKER